MQAEKKSDSEETAVHAEVVKEEKRIDPEKKRRKKRKRIRRLVYLLIIIGGVVYWKLNEVKLEDIKLQVAELTAVSEAAEETLSTSYYVEFQLAEDELARNVQFELEKLGFDTVLAENTVEDVINWRLKATKQVIDEDEYKKNYELVMFLAKENNGTYHGSSIEAE